jgi:hypothetical protein
MFLLVVVSLLIGFLVIAWAGRAAHRPVAEPEAAQPGRGEALDGLSLADLERLCTQLLAEVGLVVNTCARSGPRDLEISALNPQPIIGGDYLIRCVLAPPGQLVGAGEVSALGDSVRAERAAKGIFITTGYFAEDVQKIQEGPPLELINRRRLQELLDAHRIGLA